MIHKHFEQQKKERTWLFICVLLTSKCTFFCSMPYAGWQRDTIFHKTPSLLFVACNTTRVYETFTYICSLSAVTRLSRILTPTPRVDIKKIIRYKSSHPFLFSTYFFPHSFALRPNNRWPSRQRKKREEKKKKRKEAFLSQVSSKLRLQMKAEKIIELGNYRIVVYSTLACLKYFMADSLIYRG